MTATQDIATKSASCPAPLVNASALAEQRKKNKHSFQAKCDAMLYIVEFIASFHLRNTQNSGQSKKMEDLKNMVAQTRNELGIKY